MAPSGRDETSREEAEDNNGIQQKTMQEGNDNRVKEDAVLDKSKFDVHLQLLAIPIPCELCSTVTKILNGFLLNRPRLKPVVQYSSNEKSRLVLLSEDIHDQGLSQIPPEKLDAVRRVCDVKVVPYSLVLGYSYWTVDYILKEILPFGAEIPSSFETIGHIAHLNICEELLPFKHIIAQVIFDKNRPRIRTVVNKVGSISNQFRVPTFEILAGEENLVTEVRQYRAIFRLDYGLVYWNSRLEHEHKRLVSLFQPGEIICDMFAGVGPFVIPAAQRGCGVYANDLNPNSVSYLHINSKLNKVDRSVSIHNKDAREFMFNIMSGTDSLHPILSMPMEGAVGDNLESSKALISKESEIKDDISVGISTNAEGEKCKSSQAHTKSEPSGKIKGRKELPEDTFLDISKTKPWEHIDHIIMNLPASALEFLDVFQGLLSRRLWKGGMPWIHCYCFLRSNESEEMLIQRAEAILGAKIEESNLHKVRDVAPNKEMVCLSFRLPRSIRFKNDEVVSNTEHDQVDRGFEAVKRQRT